MTFALFLSMIIFFTLGFFIAFSFFQKDYVVSLILTIVLVLIVLSGCSPRPTFITTVKVETQQSHQEKSFISLVLYMRKHNKDIVTPEMEMTAATYIKNAGMDWSCNKKVKKCFLVYKDVYVTISPEFVEIEMDNGNRVYKIYDAENAARIIYSR